MAGDNLDFKCVSGSRDSDVGDVYDVNDMDITTSPHDAFFTFQRTIGAIHVQSARGLEEKDVGIYTCIIPDETESNATVHVGLYRDESDGKQSLYVFFCDENFVGKTDVFINFFPPMKRFLQH